MKQILKKFSATVGLFVFLFLLAAIPGSKADAATLKNGAVAGPIGATTSGEYHKLVMAKDGYVSLSVLSKYQDSVSRSICDISIHNSSKKRLSDYKYNNYFASYNYMKEQFFALKKGTYYVKVTMREPIMNYYHDGTQSWKNLQNKYYVATAVKYITDSAATKKSKATTIKLKASKQGLIKLTDARSSSSGSAGDWYKFTLSRTTKVRLYVNGYTTNRTDTTQSLRFSVYGKTTYSKLSSLASNKTTTLPRGTYYIRLYKTSKTDSGYYKIGLNKKV